MYLLSYLLDPLVFGFQFKLLAHKNVFSLNKIITFTLLADILLRFFTAVKKEDEIIPVDDFNQKVDN